MEALIATAVVTGVFYVFCRGVRRLFSSPLDRIYKRRMAQQGKIASER